MPKAKAKAKNSSDTRTFIIGIGSGFMANVVWNFIPQSNQYRLAQLEENPLAIVKHYHWGLASLIIAQHTKGAKPYLVGLGAGLIAVEALHENPFAVGKPTFGASTALGIALTAILALSYA